MMIKISILMIICFIIKPLNTNFFDEIQKHIEPSINQVALEFESAFKDDKEVHIKNAESLFDTKIYEQVIEECDKAIKIDPNIASVYALKGQSLLKLEKYVEAIQELETAIKLDTNVIEYYLEKIKAFDELKRYDDVIKEYEILARIQPNNATIFHEKALRFYYLEEYKKTIEECNRAIEIDPNFVLAINLKGLALFNMQKYDEACEQFDMVIKLDPNNIDYYFNKVNTLLKLNRHDERIEIFNKIIEMKPNNTTAYLNKAMTLLSLERNEEAIIDFDKVIKLDVNIKEAYLGKAYALESLGRYFDAIQECDRAILIDPGYVQAYIFKGFTFNNLNLYNEAINQFDIVLKLDPNNTDYYFIKALSFGKLGRHQDSINEYNKVLEIEPNNTDALLAKGNKFAIMTRFEEAIEQYNLAININPNQASFHNAKGLSLEKLKRYSDAIKAFEIAIEIRPNFTDAILNKKRVGQLLIDSNSMDILNKKEFFKYFTVIIVAILIAGISVKRYYANFQQSTIIPKPVIFISYNHKDVNQIDPFTQMLTHQYGLELWIDKECLEPGDDWKKQIVKGINISKLVLCFITNNYLKSKNCRDEFLIISNMCEKFKEVGKKFFIIMLDDLPIDDDLGLKWSIIGLQRVNMYESKRESKKDFWSGDIFLKLLKDISSIIDVPLPVVTIIDKNELNISEWSRMAELGSGASAVVYEAFYGKKKVAVKKFNSCWPKGTDNKLKFENELELLGKMKHENIIKLLGYYNKGDTYIVIEYMNGGSLYDRLYEKKDGYFGWSNRIKIIKCFLRGLHYLHESVKIKHGDLKSPNILLNKDGTIAKLADFGLSKITKTITNYEFSSDSSNLKNKKNKAGTIIWLAPEVFVHGEDTRKSDIWSFGLILREIALRKLPFDKLREDYIIKMFHDESLLRLDLSGVPNVIADIISKCIVWNFENRLSTKQLIDIFSCIKNEKYINHID